MKMRYVCLVPLAIYSLLYICLINVNFMSERGYIAWVYKKPVISHMLSIHSATGLTCLGDFDETSAGFLVSPVSL